MGTAADAARSAPVLFSKFIYAMKKLALFLLCITGLTAAAQQKVMNASYPGHSYNFPVSSRIRVDGANKFVVTDSPLVYHMPIGSVFTFSDGVVNPPICVKENDWKPGVSSLQSGSNGIFSLNDGEKFYWRGDSIAFGDYELKGIVVDTVKNVKMTDHAYRAYSDTVDVVFFKVQAGETGWYSLPSNDYCEYQGTTHVGKYAALVLSYVKGDDGEPINCIVGVSKWYTQLTDVTGVSGKVYKANGGVQYFDDLETAKDVVLNMDNFTASLWDDGTIKYGLSSPTWNYVSAGNTLTESEQAQGNLRNDHGMYVRPLMGTAKPSQEELDNKWGWRFETPDSTNAICDYYYKATDTTATIQYPELKTAAQTNPNQYDISECNTWKGATCLYLVPGDVNNFSKYRKYDGYLHVVMADGTEYRQHLTIDKKGVITASNTWEKTKGPKTTFGFNAANSYEDNGKLQYFNLRFLSNSLSSSIAANKKVTDFATAHKVERSLTNKGSLAYVPLLDTYIPYSFSNVKPATKVTYCVYGIMPKEDGVLNGEVKTNGVVCSTGKGADSPLYEKAYKFWIFKSANGHLICYETNESGYISCIEWYE